MNTYPGQPRRGFPLFLVFIALIVLEFWIIVQVGTRIGAGSTILMILCTTAFGVWLARTQWQGLALRMQAALSAGAVPQNVLGDSLGILAAAVLLIIPGFLTDILGLLLFFPPLRRGAARLLLERVARSRKFQSFGAFGNSGFGNSGFGASGFGNSGFDNSGPHSSMFTWMSNGSTSRSTTETYENGVRTINVTITDPDGSRSETSTVEQISGLEYGAESTRNDGVIEVTVIDRDSSDGK